MAIIALSCIYVVLGEIGIVAEPSFACERAHTPGVDDNAIVDTGLDRRDAALGAADIPLGLERGIVGADGGRASDLVDEVEARAVPDILSDAEVGT